MPEHVEQATRVGLRRMEQLNMIVGAGMHWPDNILLHTAH